MRGIAPEDPGAKPEHFDTDLFACQPEEEVYQYSLQDAEGLERLPDMTVDSGAGCCVGNPQHFPFAQVLPSKGSAAGQKFIGPGSGSAGMPNLGEMKLDMVLESGENGALTMQAADVRKPLLAVSALNRRGNPVWFDNEQSFIIPSTAENLAKIRQMIKGIKNKIPLHASNGVYTTRAWKKASPFQGPGR